MATGSGIGIMDEAYFVGRKQIIDWINGTFDLNVDKIESTASGAVACQIADAVFEGKVPMSKVKWDARSDYEFVHNYKILQQVFQKNQVDKHVEVEKLIRAKYQDNLEFMQWMKRFYELNHAGGEYDAVARRSRGRGAPGSSGFAAGYTPSAPGGGGGGGGGGAPAKREPRSARPAPSKAKAAPEGKGSDAGAARAGRPGAQPRTDRSLAAAKRAEDLQTQVTELKLSVDGLEKERDFYFGKLRDIEILLQGLEEPAGEVKSLSDSIFKILYATEEDFVVVDGEGEGEGGAEPAAEE